MKEAILPTYVEVQRVKFHLNKEVTAEGQKKISYTLEVGMRVKELSTKRIGELKRICVDGRFWLAWIEWENVPNILASWVECTDLRRVKE